MLIASFTRYREATLLEDIFNLRIATAEFAVGFIAGCQQDRAEALCGFRIPRVVCFLESRPGARNYFPARSLTKFGPRSKGS
ncbi:hypothetical protein AZE99_02830 [Sphingorhabdus sp. M41]|nr:hypothetical protein AZE99_02830 [Sphingorhabdus sp. M41]